MGTCARYDAGSILPGQIILGDRIEKETRLFVAPSQTLLAENAWQEIELWVLAGQRDLPADWQWQDTRAEVHPKEMYFLPYARTHNLLDALGEGRRRLGQDAAKNYQRIAQLCPEVDALQKGIVEFMAI